MFGHTACVSKQTHAMRYRFRTHAMRPYRDKFW